MLSFFDWDYLHLTAQTKEIYFSTIDALKFYYYLWAKKYYRAHIQDHNHFGPVQNGLDQPKRIGSVQNKLDLQKDKAVPYVLTKRVVAYVPN